MNTAASKNMKTQILATLWAGVLFALGSVKLLAQTDEAIAEKHLGITLYALSVTQQESTVVVEWQTADEGRLIGFNLYRGGDESRSFQRLNEQLLSCLLNENGGVYRFRDETVVPGVRYAYRVDGLGTDGAVLCTTTGMCDTFVAKAVHAQNKASEPLYTMTEHPMIRGGRAASRGASVSREAVGSPIRQGAARPGSRLKIRVREKGVYFLNASTIGAYWEMSTADVGALLDERMLRLSCQGEKCAWIPARDGDGLFFYNDGISSLYTEYNVFWLEIARGIVLPEAETPPPEASAEPMSRMKTFYLEEQLNTQINRYYNYLEDYWLWTYVYGSTNLNNTGTNVDFSLCDIDFSGATAQVEMVFCGGSNSGVSNEHHAVISINGTQIGESRWQQAVLHTGRYTFASSILSNGQNVVNMRGLLDSGAAYSLFFMDRLTITALVHLQAEQNYILLDPSTCAVTRVSGFTTTNLHVAELVDRTTIRSLKSLRVTDAGGGVYAVGFASTNVQSHYALFSKDGAKQPSEVRAVGENSLRSSTNAVDYLLITHTNLYAETMRLAQFRTQQQPELKARVVTVDEVYDAFSYGLATPEAITRCLDYAYRQWAQAPTYVLFGGEGSYDYKNYKGTDENLIPVVLIRTVDGIYSADNLMADVTGDCVPDFSIGRLPAATPDEMSNMVSKIIAHDTAPGGAWTGTAAFAADNADKGGNFRQSCNNMADLFPASFIRKKIYMDEKVLSTARSELRNAFNSGISYFVYFGHGGWNQLAAEGLLKNTDLPNLTNAPCLPIVVLHTCVPNRFDVAGYDYIGEAFLLTPRHGGVAAWGPSGESLNSLAETYCSFFFEDHFNEPSHRLGDAARQATARYRSMGYDLFECKIMTLLGDPMTIMR